MEYQTIDMDTYIEFLEYRRKEIEPRGWTVPQCVWEYFIEIVRDCGMDKDRSSPSYVVDNLAVNGDYGPYSDYKEKGETDEDFERRVEEEAILLEEEDGTKYVCFSL